MRPLSFNRPVQGTASDLGRQSISIQFLLWDEDHGRVVDEEDTTPTCIGCVVS